MLYSAGFRQSRHSKHFDGDWVDIKHTHTLAIENSGIPPSTRIYHFFPPENTTEFLIGFCDHPWARERTPRAPPKQKHPSAKPRVVAEHNKGM